MLLSDFWRDVGHPVPVWKGADKKTLATLRLVQERLVRFFSEEASIPLHRINRTLLLDVRMIEGFDALVGDTLSQIEPLAFSDRPHRRITQVTHAMLAKIAQRVASRAVVLKHAPGFEGYFQAERAFTGLFFEEIVGYQLQLDAVNSLAVRGAWNAYYEPRFPTCPRTEEVTFLLSLAAQQPHNREFLLTEILRLLEPEDCLPEEVPEEKESPAKEGVPSLVDLFQGKKEEARRSEASPQVQKALAGLQEALRLQPRTVQVSVDVLEKDEGRRKGPSDYIARGSFEGIDVPKVVHALWVERADDAARALYQKGLSAVRPYINRLREALVFRNEARGMDHTGLRRGSVNPRALHRLPMGDLRVFQKRTVEARPSVLLGILVDESGSMSREERDAMARQSAIMIFHALQGLQGVRLGIWGHTGDVKPFGRGCLVHRFVEPGDDRSPAVLARIAGQGENYDGFAIEYVVQHMQNMKLPEERCVLIVLSDGNPSGEGYKGEAARSHTHNCIEKARKEGVAVLGVGLGKHLDLIEFRTLYGRDALQVKDISHLPGRLGRLVTKVLS